MKYKLGLSAIIFLLIGTISLIIENTYYQHLDKSGFLQESFFLPMGAFSLIISATLTCIIIVNKIIKIVRKTHDQQ